LLFASIPNPLFDLAGLTSGHFLVPFYTFFIATLIGKAVIKVSIQSLFVVAVFRKDTLETQLAWLESTFPFIRGKLKPLLEDVEKKFHRQPGTEIVTTSEKSILATVWELFVALMILYFVVSAINSTVNEYLVTKDEEEVQKLISKGSNNHLLNSSNKQPTNRNPIPSRKRKHKKYKPNSRKSSN